MTVFNIAVAFDDLSKMVAAGVALAKRGFAIETFDAPVFWALVTIPVEVGIKMVRVRPSRADPNSRIKRKPTPYRDRQASAVYALVLRIIKPFAARQLGTGASVSAQLLAAVGNGATEDAIIKAMAPPDPRFDCFWFVPVNLRVAERQNLVCRVERAGKPPLFVPMLTTRQ